MKTVPDNSSRGSTSQWRMGLSELGLLSRFGRRGLALAGGVCGLLLAVAATPQLLGPEVRRSFDGLERAQPAWLWLAAVCFVAALLANAFAWRATIGLCGGEIGRLASVACYGVGSVFSRTLLRSTDPLGLSALQVAAAPCCLCPSCSPSRASRTTL